MRKTIDAKLVHDTYSRTKEYKVEQEFCSNQGLGIDRRLLNAAYQGLEYIVIGRADSFEEHSEVYEKYNDIQKEYFEKGFRTHSQYEASKDGVYVKEWAIYVEG